MRWLALVLLLSVSPACSLSSPAKPKAEQADGKKSAKKADGAKKGDKAAQRPTKDKGAKRPPGKKGEQRPAPPMYGSPGKVVAELKLEQGKEGDEVRTTAELALVSGEGKEETVSLGAITGTCAEKTPAEVNEVTALWTVACTSEQGGADVSIVQQGQALVVARHAEGTDGYKPVRRVRLVKGAEVERKPTAKADAAP